MKVNFDNEKHESLVNNSQALCRRYDRKGVSVAQEILIVLEVLRSADSLGDVPPGYHPHPLKGEYKGFFAVDVTNKDRMIFRPDHVGDPNYRIDNPKTITAISIIEIFKDYH